MPSLPDFSYPPDCCQLLRVLCSDWDSPTGVLQIFERTTPNAAWQTVGTVIPVVLGRNGLAWGRGLHTLPATASIQTNELNDLFGLAPHKIKQEGDGYAPAGCFSLDFAFGLITTELAQPDVPAWSYRQIQANSYFVDDPSSPHYNQWLDWPEPNPVHVPLSPLACPWHSAEAMRRHDHRYDWGVVVNHNRGEVLPGAGSCIFLHLWEDVNTPTAGCTAMAEADLLHVLRWLRWEAKPVLVQLPLVAYQQLQAAWDLP